ncbi:phosphatidate cytidylyltransferase [Streptacidiphilus fuscans]|uniref:Phosphatidate cytidylyltransferase n=1 Tax=Streptacidiphilus fuscans TaxID=2789292 RepID=A0A931FD85_9ACTN|nr:phosphatidate cytidylyltransferase [Streptacidiphilus fuscans]
MPPVPEQPLAASTGQPSGPTGQPTPPGHGQYDEYGQYDQGAQGSQGAQGGQFNQYGQYAQQGPPQGPQGPQGAPGPHGQQGHPGPGPSGYPGQPGHPGQQGQPGQQPGRPGEPTAPAQPKPAGKAGRDLRAAIGVGLGLGAVIVASLFVVKWLFVGVVVAAVGVGMWELTTRLTEAKGIRVPLIPLLVGGAAMEIAAYLGGPEAAVVALALTSLAVLVWRMTEPPENYLRDVTAGIFTAFYVPFLATFVMLMLAADDGPQRVVLFMVLTICSDTGAYAAGSRFGRHKLAPRISPGKTREGLVGGVLLCMAAGAAGMQFMITNGTWWQGLVLGACVAVSATLGDLGESMIKRDLGIKDMGTLLPGHGGIMDRLDSLLPTAPVVWLVLVGFVGAG